MTENKNKPKVMGMTDHSLKSGFGRQMHGIMNILGTKYDAYYLGWGFNYDDAIKRGNYTLLPTPGEYHGSQIMPQVLQVLKPEVLITQADSRMIHWLPAMLKQVQASPTWIYYPVIDGHVWSLDGQATMWPSNWTAIMKQADVVVAYADFGKKILQENGIEDAKRIYHGVDTQMFRPLLPEDKENIKAGLNIKGKFVVGGVFKCMIRKNPEKYLQAFCAFRKGKEDKVVLVLHTTINQGESNLVQQATDLGLVVGKDVIFTDPNIPTPVMVQVYNCFDVFWALGGMEGFNVPLIESMACGIPVVALDATTHSEILNGTGLLSEPILYKGGKGCKVTYGSFNGVEGIAVNPYDVASKTDKLYADKKLRENISFREIERTITTFDWSVINPQWLELVSKYVITEEQVPDEWKGLFGETQ